VSKKTLHHPSVHRRKETGSWFVRYRDEFGRQVNKTFGKGEENRVKAQAFDHEVKSKKLRDEELSFGPTPGLGIYADELANLWYQDRKAAGCGAWLKDWANILNRYILPEIAKVPVVQLTQSFLVNLIHQMYSENALTTRNRYLSYLKVMFEWGVKHEYLDKNPLARWQKSKERPKVLVLTYEDALKIREAAVPHIQWAIDIAMNIGVRTGKSELLSLKWSNVDWENNCIKVYASKTKTWRVIPVRPEFMEKLREKREEARTEYLVEFNGRKISNLHKGFRHACRRAGISDEVISYDLRHLFCTTMLSRGAAPNAVSQLMGHASTKMTLDRYGHVLPGDAERAIGLLPEF
jgi:integrase